MIYLDNASTSWPKPLQVISAITECITKTGANPSRSAHVMSIEAARVLLSVRTTVAGFFGISDPLRVVFTHNITHAINTVLQGYLQSGDHVLTTGMEHNSVVRPLRHLESMGINLTFVKCSGTGLLDPDDFESALTFNTRLIVINHSSNVCGTTQPVREIGAFARKHGLLLLLDTAQSAGSIPVNMEELNTDIITFTGHKGLLGLAGTGGIVFGSRVDIHEIRPLVMGGTGSRSEYEHHPEFLPDRFEAGTSNIAGLAGLKAGISFIMSDDNIQSIKRKLAERLVSGLRKIDGISIQGCPENSDSTPVISLIVEGVSNSDIAGILDERFGIACRVGLHCAPCAHRTLGTFPDGTVRLSPGPFNTIKEIDTTIDAVRLIAERRI
ncbi:MAG: aminotransferase class V-fold PLP-dependent enzyme [Candidatus Aegiribacteria sp.]|nr:aminotransferase class V-fold PLP-dependent enzyme [Candidatus Aegiribacteria sp.]